MYVNYYFLVPAYFCEMPQSVSPQDLNEVQQFEAQHGGIILDPSANRESPHYFNSRHPHTVSPRYAAMYEKKAKLVLRMLEIRIGREQILQVFNKLLSLASVAAQQKVTSYTWNNMLLSTSSVSLTCMLSRVIHVYLYWLLKAAHC